jgi:hypothetical protein
MNPEQFLQEALSNVESKSIREWAQTEHNKPLVLKLAESFQKTGAPAIRFGTYLVCVAMGM